MEWERRRWRANMGIGPCEQDKRREGNEKLLIPFSDLQFSTSFQVQGYDFYPSVSSLPFLPACPSSSTFPSESLNCRTSRPTTFLSFKITKGSLPSTTKVISPLSFNPWIVRPPFLPFKSRSLLEGWNEPGTLINGFSIASMAKQCLSLCYQHNLYW